jgi:3-methyladenine DNA glycosylase AlkD
MTRAAEDSVTEALTALRRALAAAGDPERARGQQRYMKSSMPYHGVALPPTRAICRHVFAAVTIEDAESWRALVLGVFRGARFREEWYGALALAADRRARAFQTTDALPMYEEMIAASAWWDVVDEIATHRLPEILEGAPTTMTRAMRAWSRSPNMWKRRCAILCQIGRKEATDLDLLYACIAPSIGSREFFLRKAIGWALRQYAWTDRGEIARYVKAHPELSPLSKREALKNVAAGAVRPSR